MGSSEFHIHSLKTGIEAFDFMQSFKCSILLLQFDGFLGIPVCSWHPPSSSKLP